MVLLPINAQRSPFVYFAYYITIHIHALTNDILSYSNIALDK